MEETSNISSSNNSSSSKSNNESSTKKQGESSVRKVQSILGRLRCTSVHDLESDTSIKCSSTINASGTNTSCSTGTVSREEANVRKLKKERRENRSLLKSLLVQQEDDIEWELLIRKASSLHSRDPRHLPRHERRHKTKTDPDGSSRHQRYYDTDDGFSENSSLLSKNPNDTTLKVLNWRNCVSIYRPKQRPIGQSFASLTSDEDYYLDEVMMIGTMASNGMNKECPLNPQFFRERSNVRCPLYPQIFREKNDDVF
jgi:hypothetical protein